MNRRFRSVAFSILACSRLNHTTADGSILSDIVEPGDLMPFASSVVNISPRITRSLGVGAIESRSDHRLGPPRDDFDRPREDTGTLLTLEESAKASPTRWSCPPWRILTVTEHDLYY